MKKLLFYIKYLFLNTIFFIQRELPSEIIRPNRYEDNGAIYQLVIYFDNGISLNYQNTSLIYWYSPWTISTQKELFNKIWSIKKEIKQYKN